MPVNLLIEVPSSVCVPVSRPLRVISCCASTEYVLGKLVTVPVTLLRRDGIRFAPSLPSAAVEAIAGFLPGTYEHAVLHWPGAPFRGPDRLASLVGTRHEAPGLLTRLDGTPFHYFELDHPTVGRLRQTGFPFKFSATPAEARLAPPLLGQHTDELLNELFGLSATEVAALRAMGAV